MSEVIGGATDFLFGSSEDAQQVGNAPTMTPEQQALLNQIIGMVSGRAGSGVDPYTGPMSPGATPLQEGGFQAVMEMLNGGGAYGQGMETLDKAMAGPGTLPYDPTSAQAFWKESYMKPAMENWENEVVPGIQEHFISQNAGSSGAGNRAIAKSAEDMMTGMNADLASILYQGEQAHTGRQAASTESWLDRMLSGSSMQMNNAMMPINAALGAGQTQYNVENAQNMDAFNQWQSSQGYNNPWLNLLPTLLGSTAFEPIVQGPTQQSGIVQDLGPAAMLAYAMSSKRYKKNITHVGNIKGLQAVMFEYTETALEEYPETTRPGVQVGFIAEDVAEVFPEAVIYDDKGRPDAIDYNVLSKILEV